MTIESMLSFADSWVLCAVATAAIITIDRKHDRVVAAIDASRSDNTRRQYHYGWSAWTAWAMVQGHAALPAAPDAVAAYLTARVGQGVSASTLNAARAAIGAVHRDAGASDPTAHDVVRRTLKGLRRQAAGRGHGQAKAITADDFSAILATACNPRKTGRGVESSGVAEARGLVDRAIAALLFQGGLRRSEAAALKWGDVQPASDGTGVLVRIGHSNTDQECTAADVRYLKEGLPGFVWVRPTEARPWGAAVTVQAPAVTWPARAGGGDGLRIRVSGSRDRRRRPAHAGRCGRSRSDASSCSGARSVDRRSCSAYRRVATPVV